VGSQACESNWASEFVEEPLAVGAGSGWGGCGRLRGRGIEANEAWPSEGGEGMPRRAMAMRGREGVAHGFS